MQGFKWAKFKQVQEFNACLCASPGRIVFHKIKILLYKIAKEKQ